MPCPSSTKAMKESMGSWADRLRIETFWAPAAIELSITSAAAVEAVYGIPRSAQTREEPGATESASWLWGA